MNDTNLVDAHNDRRGPRDDRHGVANDPVYVVAERYQGDDGKVVAGPYTDDVHAEDARDGRKRAADDYAVLLVTEGVLELYAATGHDFDVADDVEPGWSA